jgi:hypothetical protein
MGLAWNRLVCRKLFELKYQSKTNRALRALRPTLTSQQVDRIVVVDDRAKAR